MQAMYYVWGDRWDETAEGRSGWRIAGALAGLSAIGLMIAAQAVRPEEPDRLAARAVAGAPAARTTPIDPTWAFGGYGGLAHTYPASVKIARQDSEMTASGFEWIGKPFTAPIYYGARIQRWGMLGRTATMIDFIHAKAIAKPESAATFTGTHNGEALPEKAPVRDVFRKLEFSHGHNILTLNGLLRFGSLLGIVRPYVGAGAGITLPHVEVHLRKDNWRTYEYKFAGFAGQGLAGLEFDLGRTSLFVEYKFTYAPYDLPLTEEPELDLLVVDLYRQFTAWWNGEAPKGGRLTVNLATHHGVGGILIKTRPAVTAAP
jgi:lipid A oxidase